MTDNLLVKMRRAVDARALKGPAVQDVRASTLTFRSYKYVLIITLIVAVYYMFMASDRYITKAQVYVKAANGAGAVVPQLQLLGAGNADMKDTLLVDAFIKSRDMLEILEEKVAFSEHFSDSQWDFYSRMKADPSEEGRFSYFRKRVGASLDPNSGLITIRAQGFEPDFSLRVVEEIIRSSEVFINEIGHQIAKDEIAFVEQELVRVQDNLQDVRTRILRFQNENGILSAEAAGASRQGLVNEMENELVRMRTEEKTLSSFLNAEASELVALRGRIAALDEQLEIERSKLASQEGMSVNDINAAYQALEMELQFATDLYKTTLVSLEKARIESYKKLKHLVVVQTPKLPDEALEPRGFYNVATLFIVLTLAYGVTAMIIATIREHRDV